MAGTYDISKKGASMMNDDLEARLEEIEARVAVLISKQESRLSLPPAKPPVDAGPLGLAGFGIAIAINGYTKAGFTSEEDAAYLATQGFFLGGLLQVLAGLMHQRMGNVFGAYAQLGFGCSWMATGVYQILVLMGKIEKAGKGGEIGKAALWTIFSIWLVAMAVRISLYHIVMDMCVLLVFFFEMIEHIAGGGTYMKIAGWFGIISGGQALLLTGMLLINTVYGRRIFIWGQYQGGSYLMPKFLRR